ncbi:PRF1 [Mytilus edulis]|uniref:PRF1 n=1 Tax=Mytilus edulis TaxID=6550 RepID=A0A8S3TWY6_MYTED|nr:PRF1 [Mytilus edulis]
MSVYVKHIREVALFEEGSLFYLLQKTYNIPDQIWSIVNIPNGLLDTYVEIHKNSHSFKKSMSARVDVGLFKGLFSSSVTYTKMQQYFQKASKYVEDLTSQTAGYKINIIPEWGLKFGRVAKMYIERLLPKRLNDKSIEQYTTFINTFGTHYFNQGRFGGILRLL